MGFFILQDLFANISNSLFLYHIPQLKGWLSDFLKEKKKKKAKISNFNQLLALCC